MFPAYWSDFLSKHQLVHREISIPEEFDLSGVGADLEIFDERSSMEEAQCAYPGIAVLEHGFIPVAGCCIGSGDPFFINLNDGPDGPLYQVYHDAVPVASGDLCDNAVAIVLNSYEDLLQYLDA